MLTVYTAQQVHDALTWATLDSALTAAFAVGAESSIQVPLRHSHALSDSDALLLMPAWSNEAIGLKLVTVIPGAPSRGAPTVGATYLLLDRATGTPRAVMDGDALTVRRTAAMSAIAARYLARADTRTMLMIGTGHLAPWMARAHYALRPSLERILVWGRSPERTRAMVGALEAEGLPVQFIADLESAVHGADLISCATTSRAPIIRGDWIERGTHLDLVGGFTRDMREVDDDAVARSRISVDTYRGSLSEPGDIVIPLEQGRIKREQVVAELAELVRGERIGRTSADEITMFKSVGTALADFAAAQAVVSAVAQTSS